MRYLLFILFFLAVPSPLHAKDFIPGPRYNLPKVETTVLDGANYKCLSTPQWQRVILLGSEYHGLYDSRLELQGVIAAQADVRKAYELRIQGFQHTIKILQADRKYLNTRVLDTAKTAQKKILRERIEKYILYAVILAETFYIGYKGIAAELEGQ